MRMQVQAALNEVFQRRRELLRRLKRSGAHALLP